VISRDELLVQAVTFDLSEANVQRDYVFGWIISGIFRESSLADRATLKGGNALRRGYLPGTRFSDDLDFSTPDRLDGDGVLAELNRVCEFASDASGVRFDIGRNRLSGEQQIDRARHVYKYQLYFKDMIGGQDHVTISIRVDMTEYDRLYLPVQERQLIHPYSDADACAATIRCVKVEEALADKLKCLLQRRYCYDLFDLVYGLFVAKDIAVNRTELMNVFLRKTIFGNSPGAARSLLLDLPLDIYRGWWHKVLVPAASRMSFDAAVEALRNGITELFAPHAVGGRGQLAFYPSRLRNPILEAGRVASWSGSRTKVTLASWSPTHSLSSGRRKVSPRSISTFGTEPAAGLGPASRVSFTTRFKPLKCLRRRSSRATRSPCRRPGTAASADTSPGTAVRVVRHLA
jgi:predicted nucleotidyltransferase component of viral defense system